MKKAIDLIHGGNITFSEIAFQLGFPDLPSFSKAFKKYTGLNPKAYQNKFDSF